MMFKKRKQRQAIIDAAIEWCYCPDDGSYYEGPAVEDTCEKLDAAVQEYTGRKMENTPYWTVKEMWEEICG